MSRIFNFSAGPAMLPEEVLARAGDEMLDWRGTGMCVMEMSHRGKEFMGIAAEAEKDLRELLAIPANYKVLFLQGGATLQFAQIPMNLLRGKGKADYVATGEWSKKAIKEAKAVLRRRTSPPPPRTRNFTYAPKNLERQERRRLRPLLLQRNHRRRGIPRNSRMEKDIPLVADASSHFLSRPLDVSKFGLIYAGAQKNIGPAGLTIVIVREDLIGKARRARRRVMDYKLQADGRLDAQHAGDLLDVRRRPGVQVAEAAGRPGRRWRSSTSRRRSCSTTSSMPAHSTRTRWRRKTARA